MVINRHALKILYVLLPLLCLLGFLLIWGSHEKKEPLSTVRYTVLCVTDADTADHIAIGDRLTDGVGKGQVGEVKAVSVTAALGERADGIFPLPRQKRVLLEIEGQGLRKGGGAWVDGMELLLGKRLSLHGRALLEGVCLAVSVEGQA